MASLTPQSRSDEVVGSAMREGLVNGGITLVPTLGCLYVALQNKKFLKYTNWQSRTALTIMPALFMFGLTSEQKLSNRMEQVAEETEHAIRSVEWADRFHKSQNPEMTEEDAIKAEEMRALYRRAVLNSGVNVIEGKELGTHHRIANFVQENPFKCIVAIGAPAVAYIFYGRSGKEHLSLQLKILHTRVFGQFSIICTLLGVMGLKDMMDRQGKFVTESEVEERVFQMEETRRKLLQRLEHGQQ
eukprot:Nitzschia sp. Nitz4//scaffold225_size51843//34944//35850//NITZ4_006900-RA/size51843-processed-gene-0.74-mRNA-1//-1//CDS//3329542690//1998//frame0